MDDSNRKKAAPGFLTLIVLAAICGLLGDMAWRKLGVLNTAAPARKVLFYQDSMHPWVKAEQPGKSEAIAMKPPSSSLQKT